METKNIMLTGIGGQGTILASKLLTIGLMKEGYDVKMSEVHGMSQREGSVLTHVRYGEKVYSPVIEEHKADMIIGFEQLEVLRNINYLKPNGTVVMNTAKVSPIDVLAGLEKYPSNIEVLVKERSSKCTVFDASQKAQELGNKKVMNIILLGTIIKAMELTHIDWNKIIEENVNPKFIDLNKKAIELGMSLV